MKTLVCFLSYLCVVFKLLSNKSGPDSNAEAANILLQEEYQNVTI